MHELQTWLTVVVNPTRPILQNDGVVGPLARLQLLHTFKGPVCGGKEAADREEPQRHAADRMKGEHETTP